LFDWKPTLRGHIVLTLIANPRKYVCGSHGTSTDLPHQAVRISLSPVQLSAAGFADGLGHQYPAVCHRLLGVCVLLSQFQLIVDRATMPPSAIPHAAKRRPQY
jgi:hypothetical protein